MRQAYWILMVAAFAAGAGAQGAPDARFNPPPGLYQIELVDDLRVNSPAGTVAQRSSVDGATGAVGITGNRRGGSRAAYVVAGDGAQRVCIKPLQNAGVPAELRAGGCTMAAGKVVGASMVATHRCPWGAVKTSMRQVDARTWETVVETAMTGAPTAADAAGGMAYLRTMSEKMAKEGNAEERAAAQRFLAESAQMEAALKKTPSAALPDVAALQAGNMPVRQQTTVQRMIRVGECKG